MGFVIIPKPNVSSCEGINSHRRIDLLLFIVLAQSVAAMTTVVTVLTGRWRSTVTTVTTVHVIAVSTCRWFTQLNTRAATRFSGQFLDIFPNKKMARPI